MGFLRLKNRYIPSSIYFVLTSIGLALCLVLSTQAAMQKSIKEYQVKAVYLFNFTVFVSWPKSIFSDAETPFRICILGTDPFKNYLDVAIRGEQVAGHPVIVERHASVQDSFHCQILFISVSEQDDLVSIFTALRGKPILTVGDMPNFVERGGMIKFYINRVQQVRLAVDPETLREADLNISGNLLRLSQIIKSQPR